MLDECLILANQQPKPEDFPQINMNKRNSLSPSPIRIDYSHRKSKGNGYGISMDNSIIETDHADSGKIGNYYIKYFIMIL